MKNRFLVILPHYWGAGPTPRDAVARAAKESRKRIATILAMIDKGEANAYRFDGTPTEPEGSEGHFEPHVDTGGTMYWPDGVSRHKVNRHGTNV